MLARTIEAIGFAHDERHGPLPVLLLALTMLTGLVDAISYLKLGNVFVANMTGNVVFLGFAIADPQDFSIPASLLAIMAFLAGALAGGRLGWSPDRHRGRLVARACYLKIVLVGAALIVSIAALDPTDAWVRYALIGLLAMAMGLQNAVARRLGVPDLTTTVLTLTLAGLAADSTLAGGKNPNTGRRLVATAAMLLGAAIGALLLLRAGLSTALALALVFVVLHAVAAYRFSLSSEAWTAGA